MAQIWLQLVTLGCLCCVILAVDINQTPGLTLPAPGEDAPLKCVHDDSSFPMKFWYRQRRPGEPIVLIGYNYREDITMEKEFQWEKFKINRKTEFESVLTVYNASVQDNGVYYCAVSIHSETSRGKHCTEPGPPRPPPLPSVQRHAGYILNHKDCFLIQDMERAHNTSPLPVWNTLM